jgi:hypothetical protein
MCDVKTAKDLKLEKSMSLYDDYLQEINKDRLAVVLHEKFNPRDDRNDL